MKSLSRLTSSFFLIANVFVGAEALASSTAAEDRYIASRDGAIKRLNENVANTIGDAASKAEEVARSDLEAQLRMILGQPQYEGFRPSKINLESLFKNDQGFGLLDGLRFDAKTGMLGDSVGDRRMDGTFVEPRSHLIVTTETLLNRWLRAHPQLRSRDGSNVLKSILKREAFYRQAISTDAAIFKFADISIEPPSSATIAVALMAGRSQAEMPDAADEVFVSVLADGKLYIAYGSLESSVRVMSCQKERAAFIKRLEQPHVDAERIRQRGESAFRRCFSLRAPELLEMAKARKQAQSSMNSAVGK